MYLLIGKIENETKVTTIWISGVTASIRASAFTCDFEGAAALPAGWTAQGSAVIDKDAFQGAHALLLNRPVADIEKPCTVSGPVFTVTPGSWEATCAAKAELNSPDSSFNGTVYLDVLDAGGKQIEEILVTEAFGKRAWQLARKHFEIGKQGAAARIAVRLNKADGRFWVDAISVAAASGHKPSAVNRVVFASPQLGNLFHPEDPRTFTVTVESIRELADNERKLAWVVRDYWGAEQGESGTLNVEAKGKNKERFRYEGQIDLKDQALELGRYYEIHAEAPLSDNKPFRNSAGFAILPEAVTKKFKPEQIPFTSRDWDNRISEYLRLTDRLGIRIAGIWGGWSADPPHKTDAPGIQICNELGMGILTGTPAGHIESHSKGYEKYNEAALRQGLRNFVSEHGKNRTLILDQGNEPHNTGERVLESVRAYKIIYDEAKKIDPNIIVVATSIPPTEEYFQAGYQDACDVFDFHVYEDPSHVREQIKGYQALMAKYKCVKPIWATEIGLNSQGLTRQHIAGDMIKKFAVFFAAGGANISWFDLLYPDPEATNFGSGGDAMNVFDSRYSKYAARLDAVTYYNLVNGICVKKAVAERDYADGIHAVLFRDEEKHALLVAWKDKGRKDVFLSLDGVKQAQAIHIDGRRSELDAGGKGLSLTVNEDPLLLTFEGTADLPSTLGDAAVKITAIPAAMVRGVPAAIEISGAADPKQVTVVAPPGWKVEAQTGATLRFNITSPENSKAREGDFLVRIAEAGGGISGELTCRPSISGHLALEVRPVPARADGKPAAQILIHNFSGEAQTVTWSLALTGERALADGQYAAISPTAAFFAEASNGTLSVPANQQSSVTVPISGTDPIKIYGVSATISDAAGGSLSSERMLGGFVGVPKVKTPPPAEAIFEEGDWKRCAVQRLDQKQQYFTLDKAVQWKGAADLSATMRFLWDDKCLYVGVDVSDDVFANTKQDGEIWAGDGLQFLIDPKRSSLEKPGKYDLGLAQGKKGPQAWCFLSANAATPVGAVPDIEVHCKQREGGMIYKLAIPWARLAPFTPAAGANLGLSMIVNEDDGNGRTGFIGWFGNPHTKQIDTVGDLVLMGE
jgi:hypothetical protein